jgi:hypothetical protein
MTNVEPTRFEKLKQERRYVRVPIDLDMLGEMIAPVKSTPDYQTRIEGLPGDAMFIDAATSPMERAVSFVYAHESFEPVPIGVAIPPQEVLLTRTYRAAA